MTTGHILTLISIILSLVIPSFIWVWRKYFIHPELTVELKQNRGQSSPMSYSNKNIPVDGVIEMNTALHHFRIQWNINIVIRNNSNPTAYYPEIVFREEQPNFEKIDDLYPHDIIAGTEQVILKAEYTEWEECVGTERTQIKGVLPPALNNFKILLKYRNSAKYIFYTLYNHADKSNTFLYRKPKGF